MKEIGVREARERLAHILTEVEHGTEIQILRRGRPVARLVRPDEGFPGFRSRAELREGLPPVQAEDAAQTVRLLRDAERY